MKKIIIASIISACLLNISLSGAADKVLNDEDANALMQSAKDNGLVTGDLSKISEQIKGFKPSDAIYIPTGGLFLFEDNKRNLMAVTTTGRYTIDGGAFVDVLKRRQMFTIDDIRSDYFVKLSEAPFPIKTVTSIPFGNPSVKRQAAIFLSLDCASCTDVMKNLFELREKINVDIILVPTPGDARLKMRQLWCSKLKFKITDYDIIQWLLGNRKDVEPKLMTISESEQCSVEPIVASLYLASTYNIQGLPSVVREDGLVGNGIPTDFIKWLNMSIQPLLANPFDSNNKATK